jgi:hypothetical protein
MSAIVHGFYIPLKGGDVMLELIVEKTVYLPGKRKHCNNIFILAGCLRASCELGSRVVTVSGNSLSMS